MKPVFRRPSSIIKQFSGLTANQDKETKPQPVRFMQKHNAPSLKPTHSEKETWKTSSSSLPSPHSPPVPPAIPAATAMPATTALPQAWPKHSVGKAVWKTTQFSTIENKQIPNVKASFTLAFLTLFIGLIAHKFVSFVHYLYVRKRQRPSENRRYKPITRFKPIFNTNFINSLNKSPHLNLSLKKLFKSYIIY